MRACERDILFHFKIDWSIYSLPKLTTDGYEYLKMPNIVLLCINFISLRFICIWKWFQHAGHKSNALQCKYRKKIIIHDASIQISSSFFFSYVPKAYIVNVISLHHIKVDLVNRPLQSYYVLQISIDF